MLTWELDDREREGFSPPEYFKIVRAEYPDGAKELLNGIISAASEWRYEDTAAVPGKTYTYWVVSDHETTSSTTSAPDEGWAYAAVELQHPVFLPLIFR